MKQIYYGDNLEVLRENISDESVDLIYLDPPFNRIAIIQRISKKMRQIWTPHKLWHFKILGLGPKNPNTF
jgi:N6-adenine-specific methylase